MCIRDSGTACKRYNRSASIGGSTHAVDAQTDPRTDNHQRLIVDGAQNRVKFQGLVQLIKFVAQSENSSQAVCMDIRCCACHFRLPLEQKRPGFRLDPTRQFFVRFCQAKGLTRFSSKAVKVNFKTD